MPVLRLAFGRPRHDLISRNGGSGSVATSGSATAAAKFPSPVLRRSTSRDGPGSSATTRSGRASPSASSVATAIGVPGMSWTMPFAAARPPASASDIDITASPADAFHPCRAMSCSRLARPTSRLRADARAVRRPRTRRRPGPESRAKRAEARRRRLWLAARSPSDEHVFLSWHGTLYPHVRKVWNLALNAAGIEAREGLTFHSRRHSFATHYLEGGGVVTDLQTLEAGDDAVVRGVTE
jgi:hypothetical protein